MLIRPIITEKSTKDAANKIYTFEVDRKAHKTDIRKQITDLFGVKVVSVKTCMVHGKTYRTGKKMRKDQRSDWKKARVEILKDQKIDLFEAASEEATKK